MHKTGVNPTLALQRDLKLLEHLDELGYHEAWIGEHHSAGSELIASPEVMIAAAALPVAGNVFILAQHYGVAPQRVSTSILISTAVSVLTVTAVIALLGPLVGKL